MKLFITGISTEVGKTITSAILVEALQADYWKPVQAGELHNSDSIKVKNWISNSKTVIHPESFKLNAAASPHLAAKLDNITMNVVDILEPETENHLIIEGAGGLFVPVNDSEMIVDLIRPDYEVVVVSRHYLGSINHTMLTIDALQSRNHKLAGIVFSGDENQSTERFILDKTGIKFIGRIQDEPYFDTSVIAEYADEFRENLIESK